MIERAFVPQVPKVPVHHGNKTCLSVLPPAKGGTFFDFPYRSSAVFPLLFFPERLTPGRRQSIPILSRVDAAKMSASLESASITVKQRAELSFLSFKDFARSPLGICHTLLAIYATGFTMQVCKLSEWPYWWNGTVILSDCTTSIHYYGASTTCPGKDRFVRESYAGI